MDSPTVRQLDYLGAVYYLTLASGYPPSTRDIAASEGVSHNAAQEAMTRLAEAGLVSFVPGRSRTLSLTDKGHAFMSDMKPDGITLVQSRTGQLYTRIWWKE